MSVRGAASVDRGWAWVVLPAVAMQQMLSCLIYLSGLFATHWTEQFSLSLSQASLIGALHSGVFCGSGPLGSAVLGMLGARRTVLLGAFLSITGHILAALSTTYLSLCLSYGVIAGLGVQLAYLPGSVMLGAYFQRYRNLAYGLATMSVGVGQMWLAPLISLLLQAYGWRGTLLILAGIVSHYAITGAVLRPVQEEDVPLDSEPEGNNEKICDTAAEVVEIDTSAKLSVSERTQENKKLKSLLEPPFVVNGKATATPQDFHSLTSIYSSSTGKMRPKELVFGSSNIESAVNRSGLRTRDVQLLTSRGVLAAMSSDYICRSISSLQGHGDLTNTHHGDSTNTHHGDGVVAENNVAMAPPSTERENGRLWATVRLLTHGYFMLYFSSQIFCCLGQACVFFHLPAFSESTGTSPLQTSYLLAIIGVANIFSRLLTGVVTNKGWCSPIAVYNVTLTLCALSVFVMPLLASTFAIQATLAAIFSLAGNCYAAVFAPIAIDIVGLDGLSGSMGLLMFSGGLGFLTGPPIAGLLFDVTGTYAPTFYFASACIIVSVVVMLPTLRIQGKSQRPG